MEALLRSFDWETDVYDLETFVDSHRTTFPRVVKVVEGFCGGTQKETLENDEILILHKVRQEQFLVAEKSNGFQVCIPRTCPIKVELVPLDRLNEEYSTVEEVFMAQPVYFRVLDDISSFGVKAGSVMKIYSRKNGVDYLECEYLDHARKKEVIQIPLTQRGRFQPLHDDREYFIDEVLAQYPLPSKIGVRFINTANRLLSEIFRDSQEDTAPLPFGVGLRLKREFQDDTVIATAVGEGEGDVMFFPKTLDLTVVHAVDCSMNNEGQLSTAYQLSRTMSSCLKRVERLSDTRAHSIICPVRRFSLECLTPPPLTKPCKPTNSPKLQEPYSFHFINIKTSTEGRPREPALETTDLPKQRVNQETDTGADLEGINGNRCVEEETSSNQQLLVPKLGGGSSASCEDIIEDATSAAIEKQIPARHLLGHGGLSQMSSALEMQPIKRNLSDRKHGKTTHSAKDSSITLPLPSDKRGQTAKVTKLQSQGYHSEEQNICAFKSTCHSRKEIEEDEKCAPTTPSSNKLVTRRRPIPKPRKSKKSLSNTLASASACAQCPTEHFLPTEIMKSLGDHSDKLRQYSVCSPHQDNIKISNEGRHVDLALDISVATGFPNQTSNTIAPADTKFGMRNGNGCPEEKGRSSAQWPSLPKRDQPAKCRPIPKPRKTKKSASNSSNLAASSDRCPAAHLLPTEIMTSLSDHNDRNVTPPLPRRTNVKRDQTYTSFITNQEEEILSVVKPPSNTFMKQTNSLLTENYIDREGLDSVNSRHTIDRRFRSEDIQNELGSQARVLYGVSDGTLMPNVTRQRTRHHWHTETVTLGSFACDQLRETNQSQARLDRLPNNRPPYINVNPLLLDSRVSLPVASGAQACDGTTNSVRYINESVFHFASSQWHHSLSDDVKAVPTHLDRQGEPVRGGIPQQTPYCVNHAPFPPSHDNTGTTSANAPIDDEIMKTVSSTSQLKSEPYVSSNRMSLSWECSEGSTGTKSSKSTNSDFQMDGQEETRGMATLLVHPESSSESDKNLNTFIANECRNASEVPCSNVTTTVTYSVDRVLVRTQGMSRSELQQSRNGYENDRLWVDSRDGKEPRSQVTITDQEYCCMQEGFPDDDDHIGEPREGSDTYSYPYVHFYPPTRRNDQNSSESLPTKNLDRNSMCSDVQEDHMKRGPRLTGCSYENGCIEQGTPKLPEKPLFLQQRQNTCSITQIDTASHAPPLPPKRSRSPNLMTPAPGSEEEGGGAYLIVDLVNNPFLEEEHTYEEVDDTDVQETDNPALLQEPQEMGSLSQGRPVSCEPPLPPKRLVSPLRKKRLSSTPNVQRCPAADEYEGSYPTIPPPQHPLHKEDPDVATECAYATQVDTEDLNDHRHTNDKEFYCLDYEEYDPGEATARTMQVSSPLQQLKEAFKVSSSKVKTKKQKKKTDKSKHAGDKVIKYRKEHCPIQAQNEHVLRSSTYHRSDYQHEFEDLDTIKLIKDMQDQISLQREQLEAAMSRQEADCQERT